MLENQSHRLAWRGVVLAGMISATMFFCGCGGGTEPQPLSTEAFVARPTGNTENTANETVRPTPAYEAARLQHDRNEVRPNRDPITSQGIREAAAPSPAVPVPVAPNGPAAPPVVPPREGGASLGQYQILGLVVAEVNGTPIFANKVVSRLEPALKAKARQMNLETFKAFAAEQIVKEVDVLVREEVEFAAAQRFLESTDRQQADMATQEWRKEMIRQSGGSLELAKKRALSETGVDFDELVQQEYRSNTIGIYRHRKLFPKIQVTAADMRRYYFQHLNAEFTEHDRAKFRVIKIDVRDIGDRQKALDKATAMLQRLRGGEDFVRMATKENAEKRWAERGGFPIEGWIDRGAFVLEKVEEAAWKLQPGQISDIVAEGDAFYIIKLEERQDGKVKPFEDPQVQTTINNTLRQQQFGALRDAAIKTMLEAAIVRENPQSLEAVVMMASQKYATWAQQ